MIQGVLTVLAIMGGIVLLLDRRENEAKATKLEQRVQGKAGSPLGSGTSSSTANRRD